MHPEGLAERSEASSKITVHSIIIIHETAQAPAVSSRCCVEVVDTYYHDSKQNEQV